MNRILKTITVIAIFAAGITLSPLAHADDTDVLSFGGYVPCSDLWTKAQPTNDAAWLMGLWSGFNAMDTSPAHGRIGVGLKGWDLYKLILKECKKDPQEQVQTAAYAVWFRYQALAIGQSS
jgi:hypothetical protein